MVSRLALDIGGANIKVAHSSGAGHTHRYALWKQPEKLASVLSDLGSRFPLADAIALTMTAELCDCFATKREGIHHVLDAVQSAFPRKAVEVWGLDSEFHPVASVRTNPSLAAASNWLALATAAAGIAARGIGLLIDVGSTTTDLIPLVDGLVKAEGRTDTERLVTGELVYAGVRRTPLCALGCHLPHRGRATGLAAELFATTHDIYLIRGEIDPDPNDTDTADGRPATVEWARDRLARMVGADREGFAHDDAARLADAADEALVARLVEAANRACLRRFGRPEIVIIAGSGEFLSRRVAERVVAAGGRVVSLAESWGPGPSRWACAHALLVLARGDRESAPRPEGTAHQPGPGAAHAAGDLSRPLVVKAGGSLLDWPELPGRLAAWLRCVGSTRLVLIAGGGSVVGAVRALDRAHGLGEKRSHALALRALDLTAELLAGLVPRLVVVDRPDEVDDVWNAGQIPVLKPRWFLEHVDAVAPDALPETWQTTSDSIAARLAAHIGAGLILLKSIAPEPAWDRAQASRQGFLDPMFPIASAALERVRVVNLREPAASEHFL